MRRRRNSEILKNTRGMIFTGLLLVVCYGVSGCGGSTVAVSENYAITGAAVSGIAASGSSVSGAAVSGSTITERGAEKNNTAPDRNKKQNGRFATDTNVYLNVENDEEDSWVECFQVRLDGTKRQKIFGKEKSYGMMGIVGIAGDWLYYFRYMTEDYNVGCVICRVPIRKDEDGFDALDESAGEIIIPENVWDVLYMDERYLFYERRSDKKVVKYDIIKNKEVCVAAFTQYELDSWALEIFSVADSYIAVCGGREVFVQPVDGTVWYRRDSVNVQMKDSWREEGMIEPLEKKLYYVPSAGKKSYPSAVMAMDGEKITSFISESELRQAVKKAMGLSLKKDLDAKPVMSVCAVTDLFSQGDRLYVQVQAGWTKGDTYYMKHLMFSRSEEDSELRFEQGIYDCMDVHGQSRRGKWMCVVYGEDYEPPEETLIKEHAICNDAECIGMADQTVYLSLFDYQKEVGRFACYEMDTGNFYWVKEKDAVFLKLCYNESKDMGYLKGYKKKSDFGSMFFYPWYEGDERSYEFYETK